MYTFFNASMCATCPAHLTLHDFITFTILIKWIPFTLLWSIGPAWSNVSILYFQLLPWHLCKPFPLFQLPPLVLLKLLLGFLFYIVLGGSQSLFLYSKGSIPHCMSDPLPFLKFDLHCHWFPLCMPPQCLQSRAQSKHYEAGQYAVFYSTLLRIFFQG